jgi:hypothetical protein
MPEPTLTASLSDDEVGTAISARVILQDNECRRRKVQRDQQAIHYEVEERFQ